MADQHVIVDTADGYLTVVALDHHHQDFVAELAMTNERDHLGSQVKLTGPQLEQYIEALQVVKIARNKARIADLR